MFSVSQAQNSLACAASIAGGGQTGQCAIQDALFKTLICPTHDSRTCPVSCPANAVSVLLPYSGDRFYDIFIPFAVRAQNNVTPVIRICSSSSCSTPSCHSAASMPVSYRCQPDLGRNCRGSERSGPPRARDMATPARPDASISPCRRRRIRSLWGRRSVRSKRTVGLHCVHRPG